MSLTQVGTKSVAFGENEVPDLPSLVEGNWQARPIDGPAGPGVEFRRVLSEDDLAAIGQTGSLEVVKRYRLATVPADKRNDPLYPAYHLTLELEFRNHDSQARRIAYQLAGPTSLTLEGWWYSFKVHPTSFGGAGARDVVWCDSEGGLELFSNAKVAKQAQKEPENPATPMFMREQAAPMKYAGCDAQYFTAILLRDPAAKDPPDDYLFETGVALPVAQLDPISPLKRSDVSFRLTSQSREIPPGESLRQSFQIYLGPKHTDLLGRYGLRDLIVFGWFGPVSKALLSLLHFFHDYLLGNYGLAIILLTVLVRGCMFPLSRKMAMNARKMQELAPEMKKIADKYKNDMEKRTQAQRELFRQHNYNPFGGCLLMFLQLPIFIGLYRGLSVDIQLRKRL